jgi:Uma2 family endonuclease
MRAGTGWRWRAPQLNERQGILSPRAVEGVPDLIVEVTDPATSDRGIELQRYAANRVTYYWIVDALGQMIEERVLGEDGYGPPTVYRVGETIQPSLFPGLTIEVARLWP